MQDVLRILYLAAGAAVSIWLIVLVYRNGRRLNRRVVEFKRDAEDSGKPPPNPYLALAELYAEDERKNQEARRRKRRGD